MRAGKRLARAQLNTFWFLYNRARPGRGKVGLLRAMKNLIEFLDMMEIAIDKQREVLNKITSNIEDKS